MTAPPTTPRAGATEHTATPWSSEDTDPAHVAIYAEHRIRRIASVDVFHNSVAEDTANAAFIVRACNSHDALVAALEGLLEVSSRFTARILEGKVLLTRKQVRQRWDAAEAALRAARSEAERA